MMLYNFTLNKKIQIIIIIVCYFIAARLGLLLAYENTNASPVWPPSGLALALMLLLGYRIWPGIWFGAFIANVVVFSLNNAAPTINIVGMSVSIATGNTLEAVAGTYLLYKLIDINKLFQKYQYVFWFLCASIPAAAVSATFGIISLFAGGIVSWNSTLNVWYTWLLGDIAGIIAITPLILAWSNSNNDYKNIKKFLYSIEFWCNIILLTLFSYFLFIHSTSSNLVKLRSYMILPFLMWSVFRFKHREIITTLTIVSSFAIIGTINNNGPFSEGSLNQSLIELQSFITAITISFLSLSASLAEQRIIRTKLQESHYELEMKVQERTTELKKEITEHQRIEQELLSLSKEFEKACEIAHFGYWQWNVIENKVVWSDELYRLFGISKDTFEGKYESYLKMVHPDDKEMVNSIIEKAFQNQKPFNFFYRIIRPNGEVRWLRSLGETISNTSGKVIKMVGSAFDMTEIKEKEALSIFLASIVEHSADGIISIAPNGIITSWNKAAEYLLGYKEREVIGTSIFSNVHLEKQDESRTKIERIKSGETIIVDETNAQKKGGSLVKISITYSPIRNLEGKISGVSIIMRDVTKRKEKEDARFRMIVESAPSVMILVNKEGRIELVNAQTEKLFGYTREELVGQLIEILLPQRFRAKHPGHRAIFFSNPETRAMGAGRNLYALHKNGTEVPVEIGLNPIETPDGIMVLAGIIDITERKKTEETNREREIAQETVRLKDQFLANMSHEIRTPMNAIVGFTELLDKSKLSKEQKEFVSAIKSSGQNLLAIINDILDLSKIQSGKTQLETVPMNITSLMNSLYEMFILKVNEKGLKLNFTFDEDKPCLVLGDPVRLSQILMNLISNAVKFTDKGLVDVSMNIEEESADYCKIKFSVKDTGIGIPEDKINSIFERFTQATTDTTRKFGGTGLGLSIVKGLVDLHNGKMNVNSTLGKGTTFDFSITYKKHHELIENPIKPNVSRGKQTGKIIKIMLVEDNKLNQKLAITILNKEGFLVDLAETGIEAVEKAEKTNYDVILMDIQMPIMDGYKATSIIRYDLKLNTPIIAMTAHAFAGEREKCLGYGMNDYISKPFHREELISKIHQAINLESQTIL